MRRATQNVPQAIILAGGVGSRIASMLEPGMPKQLLSIGSESIVERLVRQLDRSGVRRVHLVVPTESRAWSRFKSSRYDLTYIAASSRSKAEDLVRALISLGPCEGATCVVMGDCVFDDEEFAAFFRGVRDDIDLVVGVRPRGDKPSQSFAVGSTPRLTKRASPTAWPLAGVYLLSIAALAQAVVAYGFRQKSITLLLDRLVAVGMRAERRLFRNAHDINTFADYLGCRLRLGLPTDTTCRTRPGCAGGSSG
jgi:NDP-sugar pyrophosphorylase family protein